MLKIKLISDIIKRTLKVNLLEFFLLLNCAYKNTDFNNFCVLLAMFGRSLCFANPSNYRVLAKNVRI